MANDLYLVNDQELTQVSTVINRFENNWFFQGNHNIVWRFQDTFTSNVSWRSFATGAIPINGQKILLKNATIDRSIHVQVEKTYDTVTDVVQVHYPLQAIEEPSFRQRLYVCFSDKEPPELTSANYANYKQLFLSSQSEIITIIDNSYIREREIFYINAINKRAQQKLYMNILSEVYLSIFDEQFSPIITSEDNTYYVTSSYINEQLYSYFSILGVPGSQYRNLLIDQTMFLAGEFL